MIKDHTEDQDSWS